MTQKYPLKAKPATALLLGCLNKGVCSRKLNIKEQSQNQGLLLQKLLRDLQLADKSIQY
jgi:hypothetical protein